MLTGEFLSSGELCMRVTAAHAVHSCVRELKTVEHKVLDTVTLAADICVCSQAAAAIPVAAAALVALGAARASQAHGVVGAAR